MMQETRRTVEELCRMGLPELLEPQAHTKPTLCSIQRAYDSTSSILIYHAHFLEPSIKVHKDTNTTRVKGAGQSGAKGVS